jgi:protein-tyrosine phosphatase
MLNFLKRQTLVPVLVSESDSNSYKPAKWSLFARTPAADLYFGGQFGDKDLKRLASLGVTAIINMRSQPIYLDAAHQQFKHLHLPTLDSNPPDLDLLIKGASFIEEEIKEGGKVYINCLKARGRGPTMSIAYLLKKGDTFEKAYAKIAAVCPDLELSPFQESKLKELEKYYKRKNVLST